MAIQRIVKMTFELERADEFESFFMEIKESGAVQHPEIMIL